MKQIIFNILLFAAISTAALAQDATAQDPILTENEKACSIVIGKLRKDMAAKPYLLFQLIEEAITANPSFVGDIVKTVIIATNADIELVTKIVELVAVKNPDLLIAAAKSALAVAPDAFESIEELLKKYVKLSKPNPLDFPGSGNENAVNVSPNSPGGTGGWGIGIAGNPTAVAAGTGGGSNNPAATGNAPR
jgi:hypothetical protein